MERQRGYLIDVTARTITAIEFDGLAGMQALVGGYIEAAYQWRSSGDVLFVDEEGLFKHDRHFRLRERPDQSLAGNGLLVGREVEGPDYPGGYTTLPPVMTLDDLRERVMFL